MRLCALFLWLLSLTASADERVSVCFNYGCLTQADVVFADAQLGEVARMLRAATSPEEERAALALVVGKMLGWAGEQTPIAADRGGNYADMGVHGKMDCIDHSTTTTRLLRLIEARGMLHFHRVLDPALRHRFLIFDHFSAQIEEKGKAAGDCGCDGEAVDEAATKSDEAPRRFVVDSWFFDNGHPAVVMPLARWQAGESPNEN
ncbi:MAG: hypothetical protein QM739_13975 [Propionivibrio sp.]